MCICFTVPLFTRDYSDQSCYIRTIRRGCCVSFHRAEVTCSSSRVDLHQSASWRWHAQNRSNISHSVTVLMFSARNDLCYVECGLEFAFTFTVLDICRHVFCTQAAACSAKDECTSRSRHKKHKKENKKAHSGRLLKTAFFFLFTFEWSQDFQFHLVFILYHHFFLSSLHLYIYIFYFYFFKVFLLMYYTKLLCEIITSTRSPRQGLDHHLHDDSSYVFLSWPALKELAFSKYIWSKKAGLSAQVDMK